MSERLLRPIDRVPNAIHKAEPARLDTAEVIKPLIERNSKPDEDTGHEVTIIETRRAGLSLTRPSTILNRYSSLFNDDKFYRVTDSDLANLGKDAVLLSIFRDLQPGIEGDPVDQGVVNKNIADINNEIRDEFGVDRVVPAKNYHIGQAIIDVLRVNYNPEAILDQIANRKQNVVNLATRSGASQPARQIGGGNTQNEAFTAYINAMATSEEAKRGSQTAAQKLMLDGLVNELNILSDRLYWDHPDKHVRYSVKEIKDKSGDYVIAYEVVEAPQDTKLTFESLAEPLRTQILQRAKELEDKAEAGSIKRAAIIKALTNREDGIGGVIPGKERSFYQAYMQLVALHQRTVEDPDEWSEADQKILEQLEKQFADAIIPFTPVIRGSGETSGLAQIRENTYGLVKNSLSKLIAAGEQDLLQFKPDATQAVAIYIEEASDIWKAGIFGNEVLQECALALRILPSIKPVETEPIKPTEPTKPTEINKALSKATSRWLASPTHTKSLGESIFTNDFFELLKTQYIDTRKSDSTLQADNKLTRAELRRFCNENILKPYGFSIDYDPIFSRYTINCLKETTIGGVQVVTTVNPENGLYSVDQIPKAIKRSISEEDKPSVIFALGIHLADSSLLPHRPNADQVKLALSIPKENGETATPADLAGNFLDTNTNRRILGGDPTLATMAELIHSIREANEWGAVKEQVGRPLTIAKLTYDSDPYGIGATAVAMGIASLQQTIDARSLGPNDRNITYGRKINSGDAVGTPRLYSSDLEAEPFKALMPRENEPTVIITELNNSIEHWTALAYREINPVANEADSGSETKPPTARKDFDQIDWDKLTPNSASDQDKAAIKKPSELTESTPKTKPFLAEDGLYRLATRHLAEVCNIARYAGERRFAPEDQTGLKEIRLQQLGVLTRCYATVAIRAQRDLDYAYSRWQEAYKKAEPFTKAATETARKAAELVAQSKELGTSTTADVPADAEAAAKKAAEAEAATVAANETAEAEAAAVAAAREATLACEYVDLWATTLVEIAEKRVMALSTHFDRDEIYKIGADGARASLTGLLTPNRLNGLSFADHSKDKPELYPYSAIADRISEKREITPALIDRSPAGSNSMERELLSAYVDPRGEAAILADKLYHEKLTDREYFLRLVETNINATPRIKSQFRKARFFWLVETKLGHGLSEDAGKILDLIDSLKETYIDPYRSTRDIPEEILDHITKIEAALTSVTKIYASEKDEIIEELTKILHQIKRKGESSDWDTSVKTALSALKPIVLSLTPHSTLPEISSTTTLRNKYFELVAKYAEEATVNRLLGEQLADIEKKHSYLTAREVAEKILGTYLEILMAEYINLGHNLAQELYPDDLGVWQTGLQNRLSARIIGRWQAFRVRLDNSEGRLNPRAVPTNETIAANFAEKNFMVLINNTIELLALAIIHNSTKEGTPEHIKAQLEKVMRMSAPEFSVEARKMQQLNRSQDVTLHMMLEMLLKKLITDEIADSGDRYVLGGLPGVGSLVPGVERAINLADNHYEHTLIDPTDIFKDSGLPTVKQSMTPPPIITGRNQNTESVMSELLTVPLKNGAEASRRDRSSIDLAKLFPYMAEKILKEVGFRARATRPGTRKVT